MSMTPEMKKAYEESKAAADEAIAAAEKCMKEAMESRGGALDSMIGSYRAYVEACVAITAVDLATVDPVDGRQAQRDKAHLAGIAADCVLHAHDLPDTAGWLRKINEITQLRKDLLGY